MGWSCARLLWDGVMLKGCRCRTDVGWSDVEGMSV